MIANMAFTDNVCRSLAAVSLAASMSSGTVR
jgi:hypothetical protein